MNILKTTNTVIKDNPSLTIRTGTKKPLTRIILDKDLKCPATSKVFNKDDCQIYVFCASKNYKNYPKHINFVETPLKSGHIDLNFVCDYLFKQGINSILIEAGGKLNNAFLQEKLLDKMYLFIAPKIFADKNAINSFWGNTLNNLEKCSCLKVESTKIISPDIFVTLTCTNS